MNDELTNEFCYETREEREARYREEREGKTFIDFLRQELERRQQMNANYSLRAFARNLRMDPSALSKILSGKRVCGTRLSLKLANILEMSFDEKVKCGILPELKSSCCFENETTTSSYN